MTQTQVQVLSRTQTCLLDSGNSTGYQKVVDLARQVVNLDMTGLEGELINARGQAVCAQMGIAILLSEMKNRYDTRNQSGCENFKAFFCKYDNFPDYCRKVWGYAETRCKQFIRIGRTLVDLTHQAESQERAFILPASVTEAISLARLPEDSRFDAWEAYKNDGVPLPITGGAAIDDKSLPSDNNLVVGQIDPRAVQTIRDIIENLPADSLAPVLASFVTPWVKKELDDLLAVKPSQDDLATMSLRAKHDLANTYHLTGFHGLIGQDLDDFLTEKLNLI